jgi:putative lipoic acid-binding regulatory protein
MSDHQNDIFQFPCRFPIKAMGLAADDVQEILLNVLRNHGLAPQSADLTTNVSGQGRFHSVTAMIDATSRAQLEAIYSELRADERVRYLL